MPDNAYGYQPNGDYAVPVAAAIARMRSGQAKQRSDLAQSIAAKGLRTSGVGLLPQKTLEAGFSDAEAGLVGDFANRQIENSITDRRLAEERQFAREQQQRELDAQASAGRQGFLRDVIGRAVSGGVGILSNYLRPKAPQGGSPYYG